MNRQLKILQEKSKSRHQPDGLVMLTKEASNNPASNFDVIREYTAQEEKTIILTDLQKQLLQRWNFYITKKLMGDKTSAIVKEMMVKFELERATVYKDMQQAEALMGESISINKRFRIGMRIELLEEKLKELYQPDDAIPEDLENPDEPCLNITSASYIDKLNVAAKLEATLQKYYDLYPDIKPSRSPKKIIYKISSKTYNNILNLPAPDEAEDYINKFLPGTNGRKDSRTK